MTTRETNEIYDLTGAELDLVTGGSLTSGVRGAMGWVAAISMITYAVAYSATATAEYHPDPWG